MWHIVRAESILLGALSPTECEREPDTEAAGASL